MLVRGNDLRVVDRTTLRSAAPSKRFVVSVHPRAAQTASAEDWLAGLRKQAEASDQVALEQACVDHRAWWALFWQRSHLVVSGSPEAERVGQGYNLQRFLQASASRGRFPMKFNGSLFTVDGT